jgi:choline dehydrogenase-like flavoprotein
VTELDCDILIIGAGAAGGTLAGTLASATNKRVVLLERGGHYTRKFFNQREWDMRVLYADKGARSTFDGAMPVRGGECVGGGTTVNVALCFNPVRSIWQGWKDQRGLVGFSFDAGASDLGIAKLNFASALADVRQRIDVFTPDDGQINRNNQAFGRGCAALGIPAKRFELNMKGCIGCGFCSVGCAYDAKRGTMLTYIADATARGAQLVHHADTLRIELGMQGGRQVAVGAFANVREQQPRAEPNSVPPGPLHVRAKLVISACGAIETPCLLARSQHPDPHDLLGKGLVLHPSLPVIGVMADEIAGHRGIEGSMYSDHYFASDGYYLECLFGHPLYGSALLPGFGPEHFELMLQYRKLAGFGVMLIDGAEPANRVMWNRARGRADIHYRLGTDDKARLRRAARRAVEVMFAAGAREVLLPSEESLGPNGSARFTSAAEAAHCADLQFAPHQTVLTSAHCQATVKMGEDVHDSLIDSRCESHHVRNLMVCDSSAFPSSCGANPMLSIMTLARYQGLRVAAELARYDM